MFECQLTRSLVGWVKIWFTFSLVGWVKIWHNDDQKMTEIHDVLNFHPTYDLIFGF